MAQKGFSSSLKIKSMFGKQNKRNKTQSNLNDIQNIEITN